MSTTATSLSSHGDGRLGVVVQCIFLGGFLLGACVLLFAARPVQGDRSPHAGNVPTAGPPVPNTSIDMFTAAPPSPGPLVLAVVETGPQATHLRELARAIAASYREHAPTFELQVVAVKSDAELDLLHQAEHEPASWGIPVREVVILDLRGW